MNKYFLYILTLLIVPGLLFSQSDEKDEEAAPTEPASFPNAIIIGNYNPETGGGTKKFPGIPEPLGQAELDSLNDLEKQKFLLLPPEEIPANFEVPTFPPGFMRASFGSFITPSVEAGYDFDINKFDIFLHGGFEASDGHVDGANYSDIFVKGDMKYIAPEKFWLFGGSKTTTKLRVSNKNYNNYAVTQANSDSLLTGINAINIQTNIDTEAKYEGVEFTTGIGGYVFGLADDLNTGNDNSINAYLNVNNPFSSMDLGLNAEMDIHSYEGNGHSLIHLNGQFNFSGEKLRFLLEPGVQFATLPFEDESHIVPFVFGQLNINMNKYFTLWVKGKSGLKKNSFKHLFESNPYVNTVIPIDYTHQLVNAKVILNYHPVTYAGVSFGGEFSLNERDINFTNDSLSRFNVNYIDGQRYKLFAQLYWDITDKQKLTSNLEFNLTSQDSTSEQMTYVPNVSLSGKYHYSFTDNFGTNIGFDYIGSRYADLENTVKLDSYINLTFGADYSISKSLKAFVNFENIINQDIYVWRGYRERGIFAKLGILWKF